MKICEIILKTKKKGLLSIPTMHNSLFEIICDTHDTSLKY